MKKRLATIMAVLALPLALAAPATLAAPAHDAHPICADYVDGSGTFNLVTVEWDSTVADESCADVTYTVYVLDGDGGPSGPPTLLASHSQQGDGASLTLHSSIGVSDNDATVCVFGKSFTSKGRELDRAPDVGCGLISADPTNPSPGYRWQ